jgi:hypothetical protein
MLRADFPARLQTPQLRCGILGTCRRNSASGLARLHRILENARILCRRVFSRLAQLLPLEIASINVFRAALFSVVLTLAIGQNAGLLCKVWCPDATSKSCPHQESTTSPSMRADDTCNNVVVGAVPFVGEDGRRTAPGPNAQHGLVVLRFRFVAPPTDPRPGYESGRRLLREERPFVFALRI